MDSPEDKAVEEDDSQDADKDVHQPGIALLAKVDEPVAIPDCLLLL